MSWKPEVKVHNEWCANGLVFATEEAALSSAKDLMNRWILVEDARAVPSKEKVNYQIVDGVLSAITVKEKS